MLAAAAVALTMLQADLKEELVVKGLHLFARCWRTPTGESPYMIWTIGSKDDAPEGQEWVIEGESIHFENLPIQPVSGFTKAVKTSSPDEVSGNMLQQPGGEAAGNAYIRGHLEKVETLTETLALPDLTLVLAKHGPQGDFGPMYHFQV